MESAPSLGRTQAVTRGPGMPICGSIAAQPRYSTAAASEMVATASAYRTAARFRANAAGMAGPQVSGTVIGHMS